ncbi:hypothetical protein FRX31_012332 [Thalictrum thalictroides]|uniref:Uncharacterized protein n=1 Tax=Thalictrum thalictroides TaxID=46969 RepID=A0A7J6WL25_THATH|nr:hypothetical protein FRX31_012332 [Thalictrum thalictroides]
MQRNKSCSKVKSSRKPLKEISNGIQNYLKQSNKKNISVVKDEEQHEEEEEEMVLDRLLLVHSDLSNLIQKIDELVVQAVQVKGTSKKGKKEIDSFTSYLSDIHSSLKSWIPRLENTLTISTVEPKKQLEQSPPNKNLLTGNEERGNCYDSPLESDLDSIVSPSPLVSWCAERTVESGRQLFLLTPLPRSRQPSSKLQTSVFARKVDGPLNTNLGIPSTVTIPQSTDDDFLEGKLLKPTPNRCGNSSVTKIETSFSHDFASPSKCITRTRSMFLMTPCLKMSPPKSCVLLEPISESCQQDNRYIAKPIPFCAGTTAKPFSSNFSETLRLKYPELFGTQQDFKSRMERKDLNEPLDCFSPPKSCVLMEPPEKELSADFARNLDLTSNGLDKETSLTASTNQIPQADIQLTKKSVDREQGSTSIAAYLESTPMWKDPESRIKTGKQPGENTLKKELWTRFDAASSSSHVLQLGATVLRDTSRKGFLDRLEEVCWEELS